MPHFSLATSHLSPLECPGKHLQYHSKPLDSRCKYLPSRSKYLAATCTYWQGNAKRLDCHCKTLQCHSNYLDPCCAILQCHSTRLDPRCAILQCHPDISNFCSGNLEIPGRPPGILKYPPTRRRPPDWGCTPDLSSIISLEKKGD